MTSHLNNRPFALSRRTALGAAAATVLCAGLPVFAEAQPRRRSRRQRVLEWQRFDRGGSDVFVTAESVPGGNVLCFVDGQDVLVIDTKFPYLGQVLRRDAALGKDLRTRVHIIATHHHADHTGGIGTMSPSEILMHINAEPRVTSQFEQYRRGLEQGPRAARGAKLPDMVIGSAESLLDMIENLRPDMYRPTRVIEDSATFHVRTTPVELSHFGNGHTDNDLVVRLPRANMIHTGDLVFDNYFPFYDRDAGAASVGWRNALGKILEMCDAETLVVSGHGGVSDRSIVQNQIDYFDQLEDAVMTDIEAGLTLDDVKPKVYPFMEGLKYPGLRESSVVGMYEELTGARPRT